MELFERLSLRNVHFLNDMDMKTKKNLRNKRMFRYTSGIGQILLKSHLNFYQFSQVQMKSRPTTKR